MRRRTLLAGGLAIAGGAPAADTLRSAGARTGLLIGSASEVSLASAPDYAALLGRECDLFAPNLNWQRMAPRPDSPLVAADPSLPAAQAAGLHLTGYHLLWHKRLPGWFDALPSSAAERAVRAHIAAMAAQYGAQTVSWNVINEAIADDGALRSSPLAEKFGPTMFDLAFQAARDSAPAVLRVYNDYDLELATPGHEARRTTLLRLLDGALARGVPIQAVGLQSHLRTTSFGRFDPARYRRFLAELAGRGLAVLITELDVLDATADDEAAQDRAVADVYRRFLDTALAQPGVRALVFWGLSDRYTWLNDPARPSLRRPDGSPARPAPFDAALRPKPALAAVMAALGEAPVRARL